MSLRKTLKRLGRKTAKLSTKINRVAVPIVSAGAGFIGGAPAAAAVTAAGAQASYYFRATQARNEGKMGRDARSLGRGERKRVAIYGAVGGGAGMLGSGATSLLAGKSFASALGTTAFGQGGANLLGIDSIFAKSPTASPFVTAGNLAAQKSSSVPGLVTQSQLASTLHGGAVEAASASPAAVAAGGGDTTLAKGLGLLTTALGKGLPDGSKASGGRDTNGNLPYWFTPDGTSGGGGGGEAGGGGGLFNSPMNADGTQGMSPAMILALGVGAYLLFS